MSSFVNTSAGDGAPYWYEWSVGLQEMLKSLQPDSKIAGVTIQSHLVQGWDDVVVRYLDGSYCFIQVKHSSKDGSFTVGSLLEKRSDGQTLIGYLYKQWCAIEKNDDSTAVLFSNKVWGVQGTTVGKVYRPPLKEFYRWIKGCDFSLKSSDDFQPPEKWGTFWQEFNNSLCCPDEETEEEGARRLRFFKNFEIQAGEANLDEIGINLIQQIADLFGISSERAVPLLHSLDSSLRRWSSGGEEITPCEFYEAFILPEETERAENIPPPVPTPFFPSREEEVEGLKDILQSTEGHRAVFLTGVPGAGKTAMVSKLCFKTMHKPFSGTIGLRYFAFKPLHPGSSIVPADSDLFVSAKGLWSSLLNEFRSGLSGRLAELQVPIRNSLLSIKDMRENVLRLSNKLGEDLGRPFVIAIDGVDHAARASRYKPADVKEFFDSLPTPDQLSDLWPNVRLLVGGQPYEYFQAIYPTWMSNSQRGDVIVHECGKLKEDDILMLVEDVRSEDAEWDIIDATRVIVEHSKRNTLATVYACYELQKVETIAIFEERLKERHLLSGLHEYYRAVWEDAVSRISHYQEAQIGLAVSLACLRDPVDAAFLNISLPQANVSEMQWSMAINALKPLIAESGQGYALRHNDVRVFLMDYLLEKDGDTIRLVAGWLCDHYLSENRSIEGAHRNLPTLLRTACREKEWAQIFNCHWVFESAYLLEDEDQTEESCSLALEGAQALQDWDLLNKVSIGVRCLVQWKYLRDVSSGYFESPNTDEAYVAQQRSECGPPAFAQWDVRDLEVFCHDFDYLWDSGECDRAKQSFINWFSEVSIEQLLEVPSKALGLGGSKSYDYLVELGKVARRSGSNRMAEELQQLPLERRGVLQFHTGWLQASLELANFSDLNTFSLGVIPRYRTLVEDLMFGVAQKSDSKACSEILARVVVARDDLSPTFGFRLRWLIIEIGYEKQYPELFEVWDTEELSFEDALTEGTHELDVLPLLDLSCITGFYRPGIDGSEIIDVHFSGIYNGQEWRWCLASLLETGGLIGRLTQLERKGEELSSLTPNIGKRIEALVRVWKDRSVDYSAPRFHGVAEEALNRLLKFCRKLPIRSRDSILDICENSLSGSNWVHLPPLLNFLGDCGRSGPLKEHAEKLIGSNGSFWSDRGELEESQISDLQDICERGGCVELWENAIERMKSTRIHYSTHKDYTFQGLNEWMRELVESTPTNYLQLLKEIYNLNDEFEYGNELSSEIVGAIGRSAAQLGPEALSYFLLREPHGKSGDRSLYRMGRLMEGAIQSYQSHEDKQMKADDLAALLAMRMCFSRWYQVGSNDILSDLSEHFRALPPEQIERLSITMLNGFQLEEDTPSQTQSRSHFDDLADQINSIYSELEGDDRLAQIKLAIENFEVGKVYLNKWHRPEVWKNNKLSKLFKVLPESQRWMLVEKAWQRNKKTSYWIEGVAERIQTIVRTQSINQGSDIFYSRLTEHVVFHRLLSNGVNEVESVDESDKSNPEKYGTFEDLSIGLQKLLLKSSFAGTVRATMFSLVRHLEYKPELLRMFLDDPALGGWETGWVLSAAERVLKQVKDQDPQILTSLAQHLTHPDLDVRVKVWIVLALIAPEETEYAFDCSGLNDQAPVKVLNSGIMVNPMMRGLKRFVTDHDSAETVLRKVERATGCNLEGLLGEVGGWIISRPKMTPHSVKWPENLREDKDYYCDRSRSQFALNQVFGRVMGESPIPENLIPKFSMAFLQSEEPELFGEFPIEHSKPSDWPKPKYGGNAEKESPSQTLSRHRSLARGVDEGWLCIGAEVHTFDYEEDRIFQYWCIHSQTKPSTLIQRAPTTMNGRTFSYLLQNGWWQPSEEHLDGSLTFFVGGSFMLSYAQMLVFPARCWRDEFGWSPDPCRPLVWNDSSGKIVAKYERLHGPLKDYGRDENRIPMIYRWVVKVQALEALGILTDLRFQESYERASYKER